MIRNILGGLLAALLFAHGSIAQIVTQPGGSGAGLSAIGPDRVLMNASDGSAVPTGVAVPNCTGGSSALSYSTSANAFDCLTGISGGSASAPLALNPGGANTAILTSTGGSNTGADTTSALNLAWTANTSGAVDIFKFATTVTSCASGNLVNVLGGASGTTSHFRVACGGAATFSGNVTVGGTLVPPATGTIHWGFNRAKISSTADGTLQLADTGGTNVFRLSSACNSATPCMQLGSLDAASPVAQEIRAQSPTGSNAAAPDLTYSAPRGTGTGIGGDHVFRVAPPSSSSSTPNAWVEALRINDEIHLVSGGSAPTLSSCGTSPTISGTDTAGTITEGSGASGCTATFYKAWATAPHCVVTDRAGLGKSYTVTTTALTITNIGALSSTAIDYICVG